MRYIALLGSPRKDGNTAALLASFLEGAASKGYSGELIRLHEKKILPCAGCNACKKEGKCVLSDDMTDLYPLVEEADVI
ncbi:MAG TPA: flavodoxin family protein, partial [Synergistales bacterium]|nr:flavodoxin family protein [Synergistales bacterium]